MLKKLLNQKVMLRFNPRWAMPELPALGILHQGDGPDCWIVHQESMTNPDTGESTMGGKVHFITAMVGPVFVEDKASVIHRPAGPNISGN